MLASENMEYLSCEWIEGAVTFLPGSLTFCCGGMRGSVLEYNGGEFPVEEFKARKKQILENIQLKVDNPCSECLQLKKKKWSHKDYLFNNIVISNGNLCNFKCIYCRPTNGSQYDSTYEIAPILEKLKEQNLLSPSCKITWGDGETVLLKNFEPIMRFSLKFGIRNELLSNCSIYNELVAAALHNQLVTIRCSIDAGTRECFNDIRGKDMFDNVWTNIKKYSEINPDLITLKYIFLNNNCSLFQINNFINTMKSSGIKRLLITHDIYKYRCPWSKSLKSIPDEIQTGMALMMYEAIKLDIDAKLQDAYFMPQDLWGVKLLLVKMLSDKPFPGSDCVLNNILNSFVDETRNWLSVEVCAPIDINDGVDQVKGVERLKERAKAMDLNSSFKLTALFLVVADIFKTRK